MKDTVMTFNEIKKDLYRSKANARFSHYDGNAGKLFYIVEIDGKDYQFPLYVMEQIEDPNNSSATIEILASDLKGASYEAEVKGSSLIRWIGKALEADELIKLSV